MSAIPEGAFHPIIKLNIHPFNNKIVLTKPSIQPNHPTREISYKIFLTQPLTSLTKFKKFDNFPYLASNVEIIPIYNVHLKINYWLAFVSSEISLNPVM